MANFTDNSRISDVVKLKNFLEDMASTENLRYFFDDGFPRGNDIRQDAAACLEVLAPFLAGGSLREESQQSGVMAMNVFEEMLPADVCGLSRHQSPKYTIINGHVVNRATGVIIQNSEPLFILRGKDQLGLETLDHYYRLTVHGGCDERHGIAIKERIAAFSNFKLSNPGRMQSPSTSADVEARRSLGRVAFLSEAGLCPEDAGWQDPKYSFASGKIVNRETGVAIPDDEPVVIFRAKDTLSISALEFYRNSLPLGVHRAIISERINDFITFSKLQAWRMKLPDTPAELIGNSLAVK